MNAHDVAPKNNESSLTDAALAAIEQANGIARLPGDSAAEYIQDHQFSEPVKQLIDRWRGVAPAFFASYPVCCEIVYELHKETANSREPSSPIPNP